MAPVMTTRAEFLGAEAKSAGHIPLHRSSNSHHLSHEDYAIDVDGACCGRYMLLIELR